MLIYKALLKYGHSNFTFEIIEYCESNLLIEREQHYLDNFDFEYNVLDKANSTLGFKHSKVVLEKMKGRKHLLGYKHTPETLIKLKKYQENKVHSEDVKIRMREEWAKRKLKNQGDGASGTSGARKSKKIISNFETLNNLGAQIGKKVIVTNIHTKISTEYFSSTEAAKALNITIQAYSRNFDKIKKVSRK